MIIEFPYVASYLFQALESGPGLYDVLLRDLTPAEADFRPDPGRFTIREAMAHLADWEPIFQYRLSCMRDQHNPVLPGYDEGQMAIDRNYAGQDVHEQLERFRAGRTETTALLRSLLPTDWSRTADRPEIGVITIETQALVIPLHDTYHLIQFAEWRRLFAAAS